MKQYLNFLTTSATKHISIKVAPFTNAAIDTQDLANKIERIVEDIIPDNNHITQHTDCDIGKFWSQERQGSRYIITDYNHNPLPLDCYNPYKVTGKVHSITIKNVIPINITFINIPKKQRRMMIKQIKELSHENLMVQVNKKIAAIYKQKSNKDDTN